MTFRPAIFEPHSLALDIAGFFQAAVNGGHVPRIGHRRRSAKKSYDRQPRLLRARRERPHSHRAAEQRDELEPLHSITSSARASSECGTVKTSAMANFSMSIGSVLV